MALSMTLCLNSAQKLTPLLFFQGSVATLFRRSWKILSYFVANLSKTPHINFYQNRSSIVEVMIKKFWCVFLCLTVYFTSSSFFFQPTFSAISPKRCHTTLHNGSNAFRIFCKFVHAKNQRQNPVSLMNNYQNIIVNNVKARIKKITGNTCVS